MDGLAAGKYDRRWGQSLGGSGRAWPWRWAGARVVEVEDEDGRVCGQERPVAGMVGAVGGTAMIEESKG